MLEPKMMVELRTCREAEVNTDFDDGGPAYRVIVLAPAGMRNSGGQVLEDEEWLMVPTPFVREKDAVRAMNALIASGFDNAEAIRKSVAGGWGEIRRIMAEALAW